MLYVVLIVDHFGVGIVPVDDPFWAVWNANAYT